MTDVLTSFIGRTQEIQTLTTWLADTNCRFITLVGSGGSGKTRLAGQLLAQVQAQYADGGMFVALHGLTQPDMLAYKIAAALDIGAYEKETPQQHIMNYLKNRHLLLVLDNFEQLLDAAPLLIDLLHHAPHLKIMVTSREVLNLSGEYVFQVSGLAVPAAHLTDDITHYEAVQLFVERARQIRADFDVASQREAVIRICHLVEGLPLAIELAAAWVKSLSCAAIADAIHRNLNFLTTSRRDVPERHRSMQAVFDYSWQRLNNLEQHVLAQLSVFRGKFDWAAAQAVTQAAPTVLAALVDQSLLHFAMTGHYSLHELVRQYAEHRLYEHPDWVQQTQDRHSAYYLNFLADQDAHIKGKNQVAAADAIEAQLDNIRMAWQWALVHHRHELVLAAYDTMTLFFQMRCRLDEGYEFFSLSATLPIEDELTKALMLLAQCWFITFTPKLLQDWDTIIRQAGDLLQRSKQRGIGAMVMAQGLFVPTEYASIMTENAAAYRQRQDTWGMAWSIYQSSIRHMNFSSADAATIQQSYLESIQLFESISDKWGASWPRGGLGLLYEREQRYADAFAVYQARLEDCRRVGDAGGVAWSLQQIAGVALAMNDIAAAAHYCRESLQIAVDIGSLNSMDEALIRIAVLLVQLGRLADAVTIYASIAYETTHFRYLRRKIVKQLNQLKRQMPTETFQQIIAQTQTRSSREVALELLNTLPTLVTIANPAALPTSSENTPDALTERELELLRLVAHGLSNQQIADQLVVTTGTVKKHLNNIFSKLHVQRRTQAVQQARQLGLIS